MKLNKILTIAVMLGLAACDSSIPERHQWVVSGDVSYLQSTELPNHAVLTVALEDVSAEDVDTVVLAEQRIVLNGQQVPIEFKLVYDHRKVKENHRYAVAAKIHDSTGLRFTTTELVGVSLAERNVEISITVDAVAAAIAESGEGPVFTCRGNRPAWQLTVAEGTLDFLTQGDMPKEIEYSGGYTALFGPDGGAFYEWEGESGQADKLKLRVLPGHCEDRKAESDDERYFNYSVRMDTPGETLKGCCQMDSEIKSEPTVIYDCDDDTEIATVLVQEGNSSQLLLQLEDGRELVLQEKDSWDSSVFADGATLFRFTSDTATLELDGAEAITCEIAN